MEKLKKEKFNATTAALFGLVCLVLAVTLFFSWINLLWALGLLVIIGARCFALLNSLKLRSNGPNLEDSNLQETLKELNTYPLRVVLACTVFVFGIVVNYLWPFAIVSYVILFVTYIEISTEDENG